MKKVKHWTKKGKIEVSEVEHHLIHNRKPTGTDREELRGEVEDILLSVMSDYTGDSESNLPDATDKMVGLIRSLLLDQLKRVREEVIDHLNDGNFENMDVLTELRDKLDKMMEEISE